LAATTHLISHELIAGSDMPSNTLVLSAAQEKTQRLGRVEPSRACPGRKDRWTLARPVHILLPQN